MPKKCTFNIKKKYTNILFETAVDDGLGFEELQHEWDDIMSL